MRKTVVSLVRSTYKDVYANLERGIELAGKMQISDGSSVIIKINLCGARTPETGTITHPLFLDALLRYLRTNFKNLDIRVIESDATVAQPDLFIEWFGFRGILQKWDTTYTNLSKRQTIVKKIRGRYFRDMAIADIFENSYFITFPKLKTNLASSITCCLKNQFGCLTEVRKVKYHKRLDDVIVDANLAMRPNFCVVDGITAMGGELGPALGTPIPLNTIICGTDPVAVDVLSAKLAGFRPWYIGHIRKAANKGVGSMKYLLVGDDIPNVNFETKKYKMRIFKFGSWLQLRKAKS